LRQKEARCAASIALLLRAVRTPIVATSSVTNLQSLIAARVVIHKGYFEVTWRGGVRVTDGEKAGEITRRNRSYARRPVDASEEVTAHPPRSASRYR